MGRFVLDGSDCLVLSAHLAVSAAGQGEIVYSVRNMADGNVPSRHL